MIPQTVPATTIMVKTTNCRSRKERSFLKVIIMEYWSTDCNVIVAPGCCYRCRSRWLRWHQIFFNVWLCHAANNMIIKGIDAHPGGSLSVLRRTAKICFNSNNYCDHKTILPDLLLHATWAVLVLKRADPPSYITDSEPVIIWYGGKEQSERELHGRCHLWIWPNF